MNTWNTFRDEAYTFPNLCAKCAAPDPTETWQLKYYEVEYPEGMPWGPYDQKPRNYNTYLTDVPLCKECLGSVRWRSRYCWLAGGLAGVVAGIAMFGLISAHRPAEPDLGFVPFGAGLFVALAVGYVLKAVFVDALCFAKFNGREQKLAFRNKEFQAQFDRLNFQYSATTGKYADGGRAW